MRNKYKVMLTKGILNPHADQKVYVAGCFLEIN